MLGAARVATALLGLLVMTAAAEQVPCEEDLWGCEVLLDPGSGGSSPMMSPLPSTTVPKGSSMPVTPSSQPSSHFPSTPSTSSATSSSSSSSATSSSSSTPSSSSTSTTSSTSPGSPTIPTSTSYSPSPFSSPVCPSESPEGRQGCPTCNGCGRKLAIALGTSIPASILVTILAMIPLCIFCQNKKKKSAYIRMAPTVYFDEDDN